MHVTLRRKASRKGAPLHNAKRKASRDSLSLLKAERSGTDGGT